MFENRFFDILSLSIWFFLPKMDIDFLSNSVIVEHGIFIMLSYSPDGLFGQQAFK